MNTARAVPLELFSRAVVLNAAALVHLFDVEGLRVMHDGENHIVAQWPIDPKRVAFEPRCSVVFTRNPHEGIWRGAYLESEGPKAWNLKHSVPRFSDLLHVGIWLRGHAPQDEQSGPARVV